MTNEDKLLMAARNMEKFGGSFASHIAAAYFSADSSNRKKLLEAFGDLFERYAKFQEIA
jgi:hypothetical protein